jgi:putative intracellular protease/amidase
MTTVGFLLFPGIQFLDFAGPCEIFAALPDCEIRLFWKTLEPISCSTGLLLHPNTALNDSPPVDVLCIPGGAGINALLLDDEVVQWVKQEAAKAQWIHRSVLEPCCWVWRACLKGDEPRRTGAITICSLSLTLPRSKSVWSKMET